MLISFSNLKTRTVHVISLPEIFIDNKSDEKRKAVLQLLNDPEWSQWSNREIAKQCSVSHKLVDSLKLSVTAERSSEKLYINKHGKRSRMRIVKSRRRSSSVTSCPDCERLKERIAELEQEKEEKMKEKREERKESNKEKKEEKKESKKEEKECITLSPAGREFRESFETHHECRVGQLTISEITSQRTAIKRLWNFSNHGVGSEKEFLDCYDALATARY